MFFFLLYVGLVLVSAGLDMGKGETQGGKEKGTRKRKRKRRKKKEETTGSKAKNESPSEAITGPE